MRNSYLGGIARSLLVTGAICATSALESTANAQSNELNRSISGPFYEVKVIGSTTVTNNYVKIDSENAVPGTLVTFQKRADLRHTSNAESQWTTISSVNAGPDGKATAKDPFSKSYTQMFYRAIGTKKQ